MDVVGVRQSPVMDSVLDYLRQRQHLWDFLDLWDIDETSITLGLLLESASHLGLPVVSTSSIEPRPYLATTSDWRSYYRSTISQRLRQNIERRTRLLQQRGALAFVKAEPSTMMSHLASLFELYQKCETSRNKSVMFSEAVYRDFYQSLAQTCPFEWLDCPTLELNGKAIAASFGFRYNSRLLGCTMAFDPEYARLAPGTVLLGHMIQDCFADDGIQELDFGSGGEAYKYEWTTTQRRACQVLIGNVFTGGWIRKVLRQSPVAVRRLLVPPLTALKGSRQRSHCT
jgi:CelD/BcsL family acetyltransferase involved in cellulose biosynthesis